MTSRLLAAIFPAPLQARSFGVDHVAVAVDRVCDELFSWGYGTSLGKREIPSVVCTALLLNRRPILEDLSLDVLAKARAQVGSRSLAVVVVHVSQALVSLGCIEDGLMLERGARPDLKYETRLAEFRIRGSTGANGGVTRLPTHPERVSRTFHVS
jgi:hypothetical protein